MIDHGSIFTVGPSGSLTNRIERNRCSSTPSRRTATESGSCTAVTVAATRRITVGQDTPTSPATADTDRGSTARASTTRAARLKVEEPPRSGPGARSSLGGRLGFPSRTRPEAPALHQKQLAGSGWRQQPTASHIQGQRATHVRPDRSDRTGVLPAPSETTAGPGRRVASAPSTSGSHATKPRNAQRESCHRPDPATECITPMETTPSDILTIRGNSMTSSSWRPGGSTTHSSSDATRLTKRPFTSIASVRIVRS